MTERIITIRLSAADINAVLARVSAAHVRFAHGAFVARKDLPLVSVAARVHLDARAGRLRLAIPFAEIEGVRGAGWLVRRTLQMTWHWLDARLEEAIVDQLAAHGLPWDLVWVDGYRDPHGGKVATVNISPVVLNDWLGQQPLPGGLRARLVEVDVEPEALLLKLQLAAPAPGERHEPNAP
jgi:hypothetical protein